MNKFFSFMLYILILFYFSIEFEYELKRNFDIEESIVLTFEYKKCTNTIPSLSIPIILAPTSFYDDSSLEMLDGRRVSTNTPLIFNTNEEFSGILFKRKEDNSLWAVEDGELLGVNCYLGLSYRLPNSSLSGLENNEINLFNLNRTRIIESPIFSFDKWNELINKSISSRLYYGENHEDFISNPGIIGPCKIIENGEYWGCFFDNIYFNDKNISLISNETKENYNIYFTSEKSEIIFPLSFQDDFLRITDDHCNILTVPSGKNLFCDYFEKEDYFEMILSNENMDITIEIDNYKKYKLNPIDEDKNRTRIYFKDIEYIIFPLMMFKKFHVQFNAEENVINFYTNDSSILKIKKKPHKDDSSSDSNGLTIFLVILIIIIIIIIGFGIFYFIKKRNKTYHEGDINKFNRFEDDEGQLNSMNEKVF